MADFTLDVNQAMQAGYQPQDIQNFIAQQKAKGNNYQANFGSTPQQNQLPPTPQPRSNFIADALPTVGSIVGGVAGAAIPILGETGVGEIGGAAAGSALGETAKELLEGQPLSGRQIATQGVMGGIGGAVGKGIGYVAGKILPKIGESAPILDDVATSLKQGTRQIRVKPSVYGASQEQAINATLDKYGINGTAQQQYSQLQPALQKIEGKIGQVIENNPNIGASRQDIEGAFMKNLDSSLRSKDITAPQAKDEIQGYLNDLLKASGATPITNPIYGADGKLIASTGENDVIPLDQLRQLKKLVNNDYGPVYAKMQSGGSLTPRQNVISAAWDSLDSAVKDASPEVKSLLTDESNIYKSARSLSSARSNPPTLRVAGTSVPQVVTQTARDIGAGAATKTGNILQKTPTALPSLLSQTAGQGVSRTLLPATPEQASQNTQDGQNYPQNNGQPNETQNNTSSNLNQNMLPPSPQQAMGNYNSTIPQSQALPATPGQAFGGTGSTGTLPASPNAAFQAQPPANFMKGWTISGKQVDPATANMIWQIVNYRLDPTKMTSLKNNQREQLISLASQYDPTYTSSQFPVIQKTREDFTSGKSAQTIRSLNTAIGHLNALSQAGQALENGQFPIVNSAKNEISQGTGHPAVGRFNTAANAVAGEMAQVFKNSGATDAEISAWKDQLNPNMSPDQLKASINQMITLMGSRLGALQTQYASNVGKPAEFSFLSPESQQILQNLGVDPNSMAAQ